MPTAVSGESACFDSGESFGGEAGRLSFFLGQPVIPEPQVALDQRLKCDLAFPTISWTLRSRGAITSRNARSFRCLDGLPICRARAPGPSQDPRTGTRSARRAATCPFDLTHPALEPPRITRPRRPGLSQLAGSGPLRARRGGPPLTHAHRSHCLWRRAGPRRARRTWRSDPPPRGPHAGDPVPVGRLTIGGACLRGPRGLGSWTAASHVSRAFRRLPTASPGDPFPGRPQRRFQRGEAGPDGRDRERPLIILSEATDPIARGGRRRPSVPAPSAIALALALASLGLQPTLLRAAGRPRALPCPPGRQGPAQKRGQAFPGLLEVATLFPVGLAAHR